MERGKKNQTMYFGYQAWKQGFVLHPKLGCSIYYCTSWCKGYRKPSKWVSVVPIVISNDMLCDERRRALLNKFKKVSTVNKININRMSRSQKWTKIHTALFLLFYFWESLKYIKKKKKSKSWKPVCILRKWVCTNPIRQCIKPYSSSCSLMTNSD